VLSFTPAADANGSSVVSVTLKDSGGTLNGGSDTSETVTFTITVNPVNDPPEFTPGDDVTVGEDSGLYSAPWATGIRPGPITATDELSQIVTFTVTSDNAGLFALTPTITSSGVLSFTPAANANGSAVVSVTLKDSGGTLRGGLDTSETVTFTLTVEPTNEPSSITVTKTATPASVPESGGSVTYTVVVTNTSAVDQVTIDTVEDDRFPDVSCPETTLSPNESFTCAYVRYVSGEAGITHTNVVTVSGSDDDGDPVSASASAHVVIEDVPSSISVTLTAEPASVLEPGEPVTFAVTVENLSSVDTVTITKISSITKTANGDVSSQADCAAGAVIAAGDSGNSYECSFSAIVSGSAGVTVTSVVTVEAIDDDGNVLSAVAEATVIIVEKPDHILYLPTIVKSPPTTFLYVTNNTGGKLTFKVVDVGVSCLVPANQTVYCGSFPPTGPGEKYKVQAVTDVCGTGEDEFPFPAGRVDRSVSCGN
jgi:hypothetical protein